jgi:hypothetical protein
MTEIVSSASQCPSGTVASRTSFMLGSGYVNSPSECPSNLMAIRIPIYGLSDSCPLDAMSLDTNGYFSSSQCPAPGGTHKKYIFSLNECYIEKDKTLSDDIGEFIYTEDCYYE